MGVLFLKEKFFFRRNIFGNKKPAADGEAAEQDAATAAAKSDSSDSGCGDECELAEMSVNEIVNGSERFPGCIQLIKDYLSNLDIDVDTQCTIKQYLSLIEARASGKLLTTASWIRKFVRAHPKYKQDSRISDEINYDLMWRLNLISNGQIKCPDLLPSYSTKSTVGPDI